MTQDKKTLIYEAALSFVYENHDYNSIKVADIAQRANIGKSTVYEYFDSKEQVIGEALIYMIRKGIAAFELLVDEDRGFKETYFMLMSNLSKMSSNRSMYNIMTMNQDNLDIHVAIKRILHVQLEELRDIYFNMVEKIVDKSVQEGIIPKRPSRYDWQTAVLCSMTCIFVHKQFRDEFNDITEAEVLDKAYNTYIKLLS